MTSPPATSVESKPVTPADSSAPKRQIWALLGVALIAGAAVGFWLGSQRGGVFETVGTAHSVEAQISIETNDWTYNVPLDVAWTDSSGTFHEGGRPECLPPTPGVIRGIRFSAVPVETHGVAFRQVVAVHCD